MQTRFILPVFLFLLLQDFTSEAKQRPNIVFILADDCTKWDLACYGNQDSKTPTIDKLASEGIKFTKCYQHAPMCSPTRHSIYTGQYPVRTGAHPNHTYAKKGIKSAAQYLKPLGYRVALSGKRHIMPKKIFDFEYLGGHEKKETNPEFDKIDTFLGDAKSKNENFCLYVCSTEPHSPWNRGDTTLFDINTIQLPPYLAETPLTRENFRNYLAEINYLDGQVKQTLDLLKKHNVLNNTLVIFASEQGNSFPFAKWTCYNAGLSSALIAYWPGKIKPGLVSNALVEYVDLLPTFIEVAGGKKENNLDGKSLTHLFKHPEQDHKKYTYGLQTTRGIYAGSSYYPIRSISDGTFRLILNLTPDMTFKNSVVVKDKYFKEWLKSDNEAIKALANKYMHRPEIELFNDKNDPYNLINLAEAPEYKEKIEELKKELYKWMDYCGDKGIETELSATTHNRKNFNGNKYTVEVELHDALPNGNFKVEKEGYYTFFTKNDIQIYIDGKLIVNTPVNNKQPEKLGVIGLKPGKHNIEIKPSTTGKIKISWNGPDFGKKTFNLL